MLKKLTAKVKYFRKMLHRRCLTVFLIRLCISSSQHSLFGENDQDKIITDPNVENTREYFSKANLIEECIHFKLPQSKVIYVPCWPTHPCWTMMPTRRVVIKLPCVLSLFTTLLILFRIPLLNILCCLYGIGNKWHWQTANLNLRTENNTNTSK